MGKLTDCTMTTDQKNVVECKTKCCFEPSRQAANTAYTSPLHFCCQNAELRARGSIVGQRKARLLQSVTSDLAESKRLKSAIEGMHMDMGRLNDFIGKSGRREKNKLN